MFLRKQGRRVYLLHSYRDGRGRVCQRRLAHFVDAVSLERQLADLPTRCPDIDSKAISKIREQAEDLLPKVEVKSVSRAERIRRATRALLTLLAEGENPGEVAGELELLRVRLSVAPAKQAGTETEENLREQVLATRGHISARRRRLDPTEAMARPYIDATNRLANFLIRQNRPQESAEILEQRVSLCPTADARLTYGAVLHRLGRRTEALEQYSLVPKGLAYRHYNSAAACWGEGLQEQAMVHLLHGLMRDPQVVEGLKLSKKGEPRQDYWHEFGDLWTEAGRRFVLAVCSQLLVRWRLREALNRGVQVRNLVPVRSRAWFLEKVLAEKKPKWKGGRLPLPNES